MKKKSLQLWNLCDLILNESGYFTQLSLNMKNSKIKLYDEHVKNYRTLD